MTDPAIIEAAARALCEVFVGENKWNNFSPVVHDRYRSHAKVILAAVAPLIEAAALERAAQTIEGQLIRSDFPRDLPTVRDGAAAIRTLKGQP